MKFTLINPKVHPLNELFPLKKPFYLESILVTVYNPPLTLDVFCTSFFAAAKTTWKNCLIINNCNVANDLFIYLFISITKKKTLCHCDKTVIVYGTR
jgi:hypothetical protein